MSERRRRGRPVLQDDSALRSPVSVRFPTPVHDELARIARLKRVTIPVFVRDLVFSELKKYESRESPLP
jgi:hypothetical protein